LSNLFFHTDESLYLGFKVRQFLLSFGFNREVEAVDRLLASIDSKSIQLKKKRNQLVEWHQAFAEQLAENLEVT
jgi:hypothetical protein